MVRDQLNELSKAVTKEKVEAYRRDGHVCIRGLIDAETVSSYRPIIEEISTSWKYETRPIEERETYGKAFLQVHNIWQKNKLCKEIVFLQPKDKYQNHYFEYIDFLTYYIIINKTFSKSC